MNDHEHDRFIQVENDLFVFGCVNPFCGHGSPALPNRYRIPTETKQVKIKLLFHTDRKLLIEIKVKDSGEILTISCKDDLQSCSEAFENITKGLPREFHY